MRIAVIEDDAGVRGLIVRLLAETGNDLVAFSSGSAFLESNGAARFDVVVSDLKMDGASGLDVLRACRVVATPPEVVLVTGHAEVRGAVEAMRLGALDYLQKPLDPRELRERVGQAARSRRRRLEKGATETDLGGSRIVAESAAMRRLLARAEKAAGSVAAVLIVGEAGTGKGIIARHIHASAAPPAGPFRSIDCAALSEERLEAELLEPVEISPETAEEALPGTLYFDEVGALTPRAQAVLARAVEARRAPGRRWLASTREDLATAVAAGSFRADLYYRLAVVTLSVPPLRDRPEDLEPLARLFLEETSGRIGRDLIFAGATLEWLRRHAFPGNVRELRHAVERAAVLSEDGTLQPADFSFDAPAGGAPGHGVTPERLARALAQNGGNRVRAAKALGISRATLYRLLAGGQGAGSDR